MNPINEAMPGESARPSPPTRSPVVIVGPSDDAHVDGMAKRVRSLGVEPFMLDARRFPSTLPIALGDDLEDVLIHGVRVRPSAVYVRHLGGGALQAQKATELPAAERFKSWLTHRERHDVISSVISRWEHSGVPVYNGTSASVRIVKPFQLSLLRQAGLPVPATRWTNDPAVVREFARAAPLAYKPVSGGAATRRLLEEDLVPARLDLLNRSPVTFQQLLPGEDIRVFVLDGEVIASVHIVTGALDFRGHEVALHMIDLPVSVQEQCIQAAKVIGLRFTGMDLKRDADGILRILELNSSPMFLGFDARSGSDVAGHLAARLVSAASART